VWVYDGGGGGGEEKGATGSSVGLFRKLILASFDIVLVLFEYMLVMEEQIKRTKMGSLGGCMLLML